MCVLLGENFVTALIKSSLTLPTTAQTAQMPTTMAKKRLQTMKVKVPKRAALDNFLSKLVGDL